MNLEELKYNIDFTINELEKYEDPKNIPVLITLFERSVGSRAFSNVNSVGLGIDWEHGQFRIEPDKKLVKKGHNFTDIKNVNCSEYNGKKYYTCPRCEGKIAKNDNYCRYCGQRLK